MVLIPTRRGLIAENQRHYLAESKKEVMSIALLYHKHADTSEAPTYFEHDIPRGLGLVLWPQVSEATGSLYILHKRVCLEV
jgi:hypothetical protein